MLDVFDVLAGTTFDELREFINAGIRASTTTAATTATTSQELRKWFAQILFYSMCQFSKDTADHVLSFLCKKMAILKKARSLDCCRDNGIAN